MYGMMGTICRDDMLVSIDFTHIIIVIQWIFQNVYRFNLSIFKLQDTVLSNCCSGKLAVYE